LIRSTRRQARCARRSARLGDSEPVIAALTAVLTYDRSHRLRRVVDVQRHEG